MGMSIICFFLSLIHLSIAYSAQDEEIDIGMKPDSIVRYQPRFFGTKTT